MRAMNAVSTFTVTLSQEQSNIIRAKLATGLYRTAEEVVQAGLRLLVDREDPTPANFRAAIAIGLEQAERGELLDGEEVFRELEGLLGVQTT